MASETNTSLVDMHMMFRDTLKFSQLYISRTGKYFKEITPSFIIDRIEEEVSEFYRPNNDIAEMVDACLDLTYYILQHISCCHPEVSLDVINLVTDSKNGHVVTIKKDTILPQIQQSLVDSKSDTKWTKVEFINMMDKQYDYMKKSYEKIKTGSVYEQITTLCDIAHRILLELDNAGVHIMPIWDLIHNANMTKFERGRVGSDGKWEKDLSTFVKPDDAIRSLIKAQGFTE